MELLLTVKDKSLTKPNGDKIVKPAGSIVLGRARDHVRHKWIEIIGDLLAPEKRLQFTGFAYYSRIVKFWTARYRDIYQAMIDVTERGRPTPAQWRAALDRAWMELLASADIQGLPADPRGDVPVVETWVWGPGELKQFYIVKFVEGDKGRDEAAELAAVDETIDAASKKTRTHRNYIDWQKDLGLSAASIVDILNPDFAYYPKHSQIVASDKIKKTKDIL